jgi:UMF1 family MFS transporter
MTSDNPQPVVVAPGSPGLAENEPPLAPRPGEAPCGETAALPPTRKGVAGWILYGVANTLYSQNMIANYFPVWVVAVMGGSDAHISLVNTIVMALMLGVGPWLGAISDRLPRRLPILIVTTSACCLLTLFIGGELWVSLGLLLVANLLFQAGLVIYDALLPAVSTADNRGRVGGAGIGLGYLGSLLGIGVGYFVLRETGSYQTLFRITAIGMILLALPCFLWVREPPRAVAPVSPLATARGALRDVAETARRARDYPDLVRFLIGRALYAESAGTIGIFMAVYLTVQLGFSADTKDRLLLVAIVAAVAGGFSWGRVVDLIGPRDSLMRVLVVWSVALALIAATGFEWLAQDWLWGIAPLAGFAMGGLWASDRPLMIGLAPPEELGQFYGLYALAGRTASLVGPLVWALIVNVLGLGRPFALVVLLAFVLIAMAILRPLASTIGKA